MRTVHRAALSLYEYDHVNDQSMPPELRRAFVEINTYAPMPANALFGSGVLSCMLKEAGFEDVAVDERAAHVTTLLYRRLLALFTDLAHGTGGLVSQCAGSCSWVPSPQDRIVAICCRHGEEIELEAEDYTYSQIKGGSGEIKPSLPQRRV